MSDESIIEEISDGITNALTMLGLPSTVGKVWSTLYFKGEMTQEGISKELGCSISSISQALTILEKIGLIYPSKKEGRKHVYSAEMNQKTRKNHLENMLRFHIEPMCNLLSSRVNDVKDKEIKNKITQLKMNYSKINNYLRTAINATNEK